MKRLAIALVVIAALTALISVIFLRRGPASVQLDGQKVAEHAAREAAAAGMRFPKPTDWDAAIFVPLAFASDAVSKFVGTTLETPIEKLSDLHLTLRDLALSGDFGSAPVKVTIRAATGSGTEIADLTAEGRFVFLGLERPAGVGEKSAVRFGIALETISIERQLAGFSVAPQRWLTQLAANEAMKHFEKHLSFAFDVPLEFSQDAKYDDTHELKTNEGGAVTVKVTASGATISERVEFASVLFIPRGLWVGLGFQGGAPPAKAPASAPQLQKILAAYDQDAPSTARAWVNGQFLARTINKLGALPDKARTAELDVLTHAGSLLSKNWRDKTLGDGGIEIYLENDNGNGEVTVSPSAQWTPEGLRIAIGCHGRASVDLHVHVDPLISGGVGTSVGANGKVSGAGEALMKVQQIKIGENNIANGFLLVSEVKSGGLGFELKTDGKLKFNFLGDAASMDVPGLGVSGSVPLPPEILPRIPILSNEPLALRLPSEAGKPGGPAVKLPAAFRDLHLVFDAVGVSTVTGGYALDAETRLVSLNREAAEQQRIAIQNALRQPSPKVALKAGDIEVLVGDLRFGSNNDIVKAILFVANAAKKTIDAVKNASADISREGRKFARATFHVIDESGKAVVTELKDLPRDFVREMNNGSQWVANEVKDWPDDVKREVIKPVENVVKGAGNALQGAGNAVGNAVENVGQAVGSGVKKGLNKLRGK